MITGKKACIPIYTFEQLEQYPLQTLKLKARTLVETIGAEALPSLAGIATQEKLINYILDVQVSMCATVGLKVSMQAFGTPSSWHEPDDRGYFGGDGNIASHTNNFLEADYCKPMHLIQPKHRTLSHEDAVEVNQAEATMGFEASKQRNKGSLVLG